MNDEVNICSRNLQLKMSSCEHSCPTLTLRVRRAGINKMNKLAGRVAFKGREGKNSPFPSVDELNGCMKDRIK